MNKSIKKSIQQIFTTNLNIKQNEKILIFTDDVNRKLRNITQRVAKEAQEYTKNVVYKEFKSTSSHGAEPPESLWTAAFDKNIITLLKSKNLLKPLLKKRTNSRQLTQVEEIVRKFKKDAVNAVVALSYYSTSHTKFRDLLTNVCSTRYASMPLFDRSMLTGAMRVNWKNMYKRTKKILERVNRSEKIEFKTPNGTHLILSKKGRKTQADTGLITQKGSFSNLPAGEVFFAPLEGTANGTLVLEWAPTHKLKKPILLHVKKGRVNTIQGKDTYTGYLKKKLSENPNNKNVAELGIGTNDKATRPDNILESEKILGTVHIALGDNSSFGGSVRTPFHQDFVFFKPTLTLIHKNGKRDVLLRNGKL
jgi:leucyl aminopeptidase (aminopeptidase T)